MRNRIALCFVLALLCSASLFARNYYVSAAGSNNNNGLTPATAWQTISKVNTSFAGMAAGDSILFRRGDTFFGTLVAGRSGTSALPMIISAYGTGEKPVISGFLSVSSWSLVSAGVYQAPVNAKSTLNMVTLDNVPQAIGRYPNDNTAGGGYLKYESFTSNSITDNEFDGGISWVGAELVIRKKLWVLDRCRITAHTGNVFTFTNINSSYEGTSGYGYFIQNDPRTLDKLGEWYFNNSTKNLQVFFGTNLPAAFSVKASGLDTLLSISTKNYITIENIAFDGANANAVLAINSNFISIKNCDFTNAGNAAINATTVSNFLVDNCTTYNILSNAVLINTTKGTNVTVKNCSIKNTGIIPGMGGSSGNSYKGIMASVGTNLLVEYNRVDTTGYVGIEFQGSNVLVKNNVVNYFDFVKDDAGGIYTYSSSSDAAPGTNYTNRVIRDNIVMNGISAYNGRSSTSPFVTGIYLDGRTMNVDVLNNTVFNNGKNGIHCNNPQNVNIRGNTSYNNLNAISTMRWAHLGEIRGLNVKNNIFYPKTASQRNYYYTNSGMNEPVTTTVNEAIRTLGNIDSNYYSTINPAGFLQEIYTVTGGAIIATSPLSLEGWRANSQHDTASKKPAKLPVSYKVTGFVGTNKFNNASFSSSVTGVTVFGTSTSGIWDNTGKISGGSLMVAFTSPGANKYSLVHSPIGAVSAAKKYMLRFSTYGTKQQGVVRAYIRKTTSPFGNLTPVQVKSYGTGRKDHEFLFVAPTTDAGGSFVIEIEQNSGTTYFDNVEFYEVNAQLYDHDSQLRFEYNDTRLAKTIALDGRYTAVDGTAYTTSVTLQPFSSLILVKDTGAAALAATATATVIKCFGDSATVTVAATGGVQPYTGTGTFKVRAGTYTYIVTDAAGVSSSTTITISQPASALNVSVTAGTISVAGGTTTVTISATGGTPPYTGTGTFTVLAGTYTHTITDANNCAVTLSRTITDGAGPFALSVLAAPVEGGTVTGAGTYNAGAAATLTAVPAAGYVFGGWSGDAVSAANPAIVTMNTSKVITATFVPITYTLTTTASPTEGGTVSGGGTYNAGTTASLTATPATGFIFAGWSGGATGTSNPVAVSMTADRTVTASFVPVTYTLTATASPVAGGIVNGAGTYNSGSTATVTAVPSAGYVFNGWSGAATGTANPLTITITGNSAVVAAFTAVPVTYTLTATANPTAGGSVSGMGTYAAGTSVTLTAIPAAGYVFSGWSGAVTGTTNPATVSMTSNRSVSASFTAVPVTYTLTATASPTVGGTVTGAGTFASGTTATLTAVPAAGYVFTGWSGAAAGTTNPVTVSMTGNRTVTASFVQITYVLTATASPTAGGTVTGAGTFASGATATLTATPAAGYVFTGWSGAAAGTTNPVTVSMTGNRTVTASFVQITYTLTATASPTAGGTVTGAGTFASGATATLTATPAAGYVFSGWSGAVTGTNNPVTITMTANSSVTATFTAVPVTYTLSASVAPTAGGTVTGTGVYASGATATLTAVPAAGYVFSGWSGAATGTSATATVLMSANRSVTATFALANYTMRTAVIPTGGGRAIGAGTYAAGTTASLTAIPSEGFMFVGWGGDASGTSTSSAVIMNSSKLATATFAPITYSLTATASPAEGGSVTGTGTYAAGATATLTATAAAGFVFSGWSGAATGTNTTVTVSMTSNLSVTATFLPVTYNLTATASPTAGGTVSGAGAYSSGSTATLTAIPSAGYVFSGWSGSVTGTASSITVLMNSNKSVTATFTALPSFTMSVTSTPAAGGTVSGAGTYLSGASATLTATPAAGYAFSGWSGAATGTASSVTVLMNSNKSVTATFIAVTSYTLSVTRTPVAGGTVTGAGTYSSGTTATLTATPAAGYTFTGWSGAVSGTASSINVLMNASKSVTATFSQIRYSLSTAVTPTAGGTVTGAGMYVSGATATLTATAAAGYVFSGWSGAASGTSATATVSMTANQTVTATFMPVNYTLTSTASPLAGGTVTGAGSYAYNTGATLTATAAAGYTFTGWSGDTTATGNSISFVMFSNKNIIANFAATTTLRIEDDVIGVNGLCSIEGNTSNNSGANNRRSINLTNTIAKGLNWSVNAGAAGIYNLRWRYANGSTSNSFYMKLIINGVVAEDSVPFPRTNGSSSFLTTNSNFTLQAGNNSIRLESIENKATADIDWIEVTGYAPAAGNCSQTQARPTAATTPVTATETTTRMLGVYPNPANGRINISFELPEAQRVSFIILDAAGNPVATVKGQLFPAGQSIQAYNMAGKAAGIYTVMIIGERNWRKSYKFVVIQ
ncbi:MAG TPA: InlB B-repeat-containing protein [Ferruginibacter sp.]|nr:InlB B-repeat-containing protein [Ferruginibacter sp.]